MVVLTTSNGYSIRVSTVFWPLDILIFAPAYLSQSGHPVKFMLALYCAFSVSDEDVYLLEHVETSTN